MAKIDKLIIEGTSDIDNGSLREGFRKLIVKVASGNMPRIIMGNGKGQAINKFKNSENSFLLIDLDETEDARQHKLKESTLSGRESEVFFMIQEMEGWFLSQPEILNSYYNIDIELPKKHGKEFPNPDEYLKNFLKQKHNQSYHKVRDGAQLLSRLDANKLMNDFTDFRYLIDKLNTP